MKTLYFDEAGYTGSDLTNSEQPYFCVGSTCFTDEEIEQLQNDLGLKGKPEIHFNQLYNDKKGQKKILKILQHKLIDKDHVKFGVAEKRYCIYAQIVDTVVENMFFNHGINIYEGRKNLIMANLLYLYAINHADQQLIHQFEENFVKMIRKQTQETIDNFYATVQSLIDAKDTSSDFNELLTIVLKTKDSAAEAFTDDVFYLDNTLSLFAALLSSWHAIIGQTINVKFDESSPMQAKEDFLNNLKDLQIEPVNVGPDGLQHQYPMPMANFELADSKLNFGIQIADLIASAVNFVLSNQNPKYGEFRSKLISLPVLQKSEINIRPSSPEFLKKALATPYNESPVDKLAALLLKSEKKD